MSYRHGPSIPDWLAFEHKIFDLEKLISKDKQVFHDARVPSRFSKRKRQVDVLIRDPHTPEFASIECRNRKGAQDVTWVEHAFGKRFSIGAQQQILVSRTGFSQDALITASAMDIELRTYYDNTVAEQIAQLHPYPIRLRFLDPFLINITLTPDPAGLKLPADFDSKLAHFTLAGQRAYEPKILHSVLEQSKKLAKMPVNQDQTYDIRLVGKAVSELRFRAPDLDWGLIEVRFQGGMAYREVTIPLPARLGFYRKGVQGHKGALAVRAIYEFRLNGNSFYFELVYTTTGCAQIISSNFDRPCNIEFSTAPWKQLTA